MTAPVNRCSGFLYIHAMKWWQKHTLHIFTCTQLSNREGILQVSLRDWWKWMFHPVEPTEPAAFLPPLLALYKTSYPCCSHCSSSSNSRTILFLKPLVLRRCIRSKASVAALNHIEILDADVRMGLVGEKLLLKELSECQKASVSWMHHSHASRVLPWPL